MTRGDLDESSNSQSSDNVELNSIKIDEENSLPIDHQLLSSGNLEELTEKQLENEEKVEEIPKKVTPLPWGKLSVVFFMYLCDSLSVTSLFPYVTFMIADFKLTDNPSEYGYYVGLLAASYFISQFISSFLWGTISDKIGRRPVLLFGTFFGGLCVLLFGFSKWLWWACICRFFYGLLNGNLGVVKSYLGEITDSTNQARAFSFTSITFSLASVIGPLLGGLFSRPFQQYPSFVMLFPEWIQSFIIQFPYVLPSLCIASLSFLAFILAYFKLEETNQSSWYYRKFVSKESTKHVEKSTNISSISKTNLLSSPTNENENEEYEQEPIIKETLFAKFKKHFNSFRKHEMLSSPVPLATCFLYLFLGSRQIMFDECYPLFSVMPKDKGGLGMSSYQLGILGGILGFILFLSQLFITPLVIQRFGPLTCYRWSIIIEAIFNVIFPEIVWLVVSDTDPVWKHILFWGALGSILLVKQVATGYTFLGTFIFTNNSVSRKNYGKVNGTSQSFVSLSRMVSPIIGGSIFASSVAVSKFPIDHRLVFYVVTAVSILMFLVSLILKKSINKPKEELESADTKASIPMDTFE